MIRLFRFSPSRLAIGYVALSVLVLALFAIPLWYAWGVNLSTFKTYVHAEDVQLADRHCRARWRRGTRCRSRGAGSGHAARRDHRACRCGRAPRCGEPARVAGGGARDAGHVRAGARRCRRFDARRGVAYRPARWLSPAGGPRKRRASSRSWITSGSASRSRRPSRCCSARASGAHPARAAVRGAGDEPGGLGHRRG